MSTVAVSTLLASKPGSTARKPLRLRISRPAPISSISARATSDTTRRLLTRLSPLEELPRPGPVLSASLASRPVSCHAGTNADSSPVVERHDRGECQHARIDDDFADSAAARSQM